MRARTRLYLIVLAVATTLVSACATPTAEVVERAVTSVVERTAKETVVVEGTPLVIEKEVTKVVEKVYEVEKEVGKAVYQSTLKAGMVDDNEEWDDYLLYRIKSAEIANSAYVHDRDVSERYTVSVRDGQGYPLLGAGVGFHVGQEEIFAAHTHATGRALFFPKALGVSDDTQVIELTVESDGVLEEAQILRGETYSLTVTLDTGRDHNFSPSVDILFLLDATGSMDDEIDSIKSNVRSIASEIAALRSVSDIRFGLTLYRDRGEVYVSRTYDFDEVSGFARVLSAVEATGGGDTPESVNEGLHEAVITPTWRDGAIRLIIWVGDAPPHMDYAQDYDYAVEMEQAARKGIKVFAIAASGLDAYGEYIWRQVAQFTEGKFVFLTYSDASESSPGTETRHHVDDYSVENLDALIVRLITEELAWQTEPRQ